MAVTGQRQPTADDVRSLPALREQVMAEEHGDANGHVNVQHHLGVHDAAGWPFFATLGVDEGYLRDRRASFFDAEHHLRYLAEVLVGATVTVHGRAIARSDKAFHGLWFLVDDDEGRVANTFEFVTVHVDLDSRRAASIPSDVAERMDLLVERHRALAWDPPLCGALGLR